MESFWRATGITLGKQWKLVLLIVVVISAVLLLGLRQLEFATGQDSYLNPESQIALDNFEFQNDFGGETVIMLFTAEDGAAVDVADLFGGANLAELERLNAELAEVDGVYSVVTPLTSVTFSHNLLSGGIGSGALISAQGRDEDGAAVRTADIEIALSRLGTAGEQVIGNPTYNDLLIFGNDNFELVDGALVPPADDERAIRLSLASTFPNQHTSVGGVILEGNATLDEQSASTEFILDILDTAEFEGFDLTVTGSPVYLKEINDYLKSGMLTLGAAALAVMAVVLALMFRVRWRLLPLLAVIIGVLWAFSIVGLVGIDLSLVTISGLPILIGLGIDFAIQIHNRVEEEVVLDRDEHPMAETLANIAPALIVATVVAILAFLALQISKVPMIRDFGVLLSIGVAALLITGIVIPTAMLGIREWTVSTDEGGESLVERIVIKLGGLPTGVGPFLIAISLALFVGGVFAEGSATIQSDPIRWIDQGSQAVADLETLEDETGFATTLGVLVEANNVFDPAVITLIHDFTASAESGGAVVSTSSLVNTMGKIIKIEGSTLMPPTSDDIVAAAAVMPPDIARLLVRPDLTATQINLRIAPASLEERAMIVDDLKADLDAKIAALDIAAGSVLLADLPVGQDAVSATPAGLATVGIGLLENLSANRAALTYLALIVAGLFLVLRFRSLPRAALALVPVILAVGISALVVGLSGIELSPLTTVSGPLVVATCAEFSVLILARFLEERGHGLSSHKASQHAARRTGRAFFTSAMTTIGGFAVLILSSLPLLRDFGIIVTLNVAIALLSALVVMPPLAVWVDERGWLGTQDKGDTPIGRLAGVKLASPPSGTPALVAGAAAVALIVGALVIYNSADTSTGASSDVAYAAIALPTTTTTTTTATTTTAPPVTDDDEDPPVDEGPAIDPAGFGDDRPESLIGGTLFDLMSGQGQAPNVANCVIETLASRVSDNELIALGLISAEPAAVEPVVQAAADCGVGSDVVEAALAAFLGG